MADWLVNDQVSSWPGTDAQRGWRYLEKSLERHDNLEVDYKYRKITLEKVMAQVGALVTPTWLTKFFEVWTSRTVPIRNTDICLGTPT